MIRAVLTVFGVAVLALFEAAFFAGFSGAIAFVHLSLIAVTGIVTSFRSSLAWTAALAAGLVLDAVMPWSAGCGMLAMLVTVMIMIPLSTRVLTHVSTASLLGLNAAAFVTFQASAALCRASSDLIAGHGFRLWPSGGFGPFFAALALQLAFVIIWRLFINRAHKAFMSSFLILR